MRQTATILCLLMAILTSCQSEHERQVQMQNDLLDATDNYEVMPNDSDARAVLFYMERHGSPRRIIGISKTKPRMRHLINVKEPHFLHFEA